MHVCEYDERRRKKPIKKSSNKIFSNFAKMELLIIQKKKDFNDNLAFFFSISAVFFNLHFLYILAFKSKNLEKMFLCILMFFSFYITNRSLSFRQFIEQK